MSLLEIWGRCIRVCAIFAPQVMFIMYLLSVMLLFFIFRIEAKNGYSDFIKKYLHATNIRACVYMRFSSLCLSF